MCIENGKGLFPYSTLRRQVLGMEDFGNLASILHSKLTDSQYLLFLIFLSVGAKIPHQTGVWCSINFLLYYNFLFFGFLFVLRMILINPAIMPF
jgi:hypothetical protein